MQFSVNLKIRLFFLPRIHLQLLSVTFHQLIETKKREIVNSKNVFNDRKDINFGSQNILGISTSVKMIRFD